MVEVGLVAAVEASEVTEAAAWVAGARPVEGLVGAEAMAARAVQQVPGVAVATAGLRVATAGPRVAPPGEEAMAAVEVE